jgi:hypothetical protein
MAAYSIVQYTGNGATQAFSVPYPYINRSHVTVKVAGVAVSFSWLTDGLVLLATPPAVGATVTISRDSSRGSRLVDFQDAAVLTEADLDLANTQALYVAQEAFDASDVAQVESDVSIAAASAAASASTATSAATSAGLSASSASTSAAAAAASAALAATYNVFPLTIAQGGTGNTTAQAAINTLTNVGPAAAGKVLTKVGTDAVWSDPTLPGTDPITGGGKFFRGDGVVTNVIDCTAVGTAFTMQVNSSGDTMMWTALANAVDEKTWGWRMTAPQTLALWAYSDIGAGVGYVFRAKRSGATIGTVELGGRVLLGAATDDTANALQVNGSVSYQGAARKFQADFSNATLASRMMFQSSTVNGNTAVSAVPNGTSNIAQWLAYNTAVPTNSAFGSLAALAAEVRITSGVSGTGTQVPLTFVIGSVEKMRLDTSGNLLLAGTSQRFQADFSNATRANRTLFQDKTLNNATNVGVIPNGTALISALSMFGAADPDNAPAMVLSQTSTASILNATKFGTGVQQPMSFQINSTEVTGLTSTAYRPGTDNAVALGVVTTNRWSNIYTVNAVTVGSDARSKTDILDSALGLAFINSLRPVSYKLIVGENTVTRDEDGNETVTARPGTRTHWGLIAQEVKAAIPAGIDFGGHVMADKNDPDSMQALRYEQFIAPLIKAVQELTARVVSLEAQRA